VGNIFVDLISFSGVYVLVDIENSETVDINL
jgi:hypothetical protein